jgi:hypothetical protein
MKPTSHKAVKTIIFLFLALALVACGDSGSGTPEAGDSLTITSAYPPDGARSVQVGTDIQIAVAQALDPASVNSSTVRVTYKDEDRSTVRVPGTVTYSAGVKASTTDTSSGTITFAPSGSLANGTEYTVTLSGLQDEAGKTLESASTSFTSQQSLRKRWIGHWNSKHMPMGIDWVNVYTDSFYDANGYITHSVTYNTPGPDGQWFNGDDGISGTRTVTTDSAGNPIVDIRYTGPGPDGEWFTPDDAANWGMVYTYDADGREIQWTSYLPGSDERSRGLIHLRRARTRPDVVHE